jgi:hypothetical protein
VNIDAAFLDHRSGGGIAVGGVTETRFFILENKNIVNDRSLDAVHADSVQLLPVLGGRGKPELVAPADRG